MCDPGEELKLPVPYFLYLYNENTNSNKLKEVWGGLKRHNHAVERAILGAGSVISTAGPSPAPSQVGSTEDETSKPLTVAPALQSAGPPQIAAESSLPTGRGPVGQDAALEGNGFRLPPALLPSRSYLSLFR